MFFVVSLNYVCKPFHFWSPTVQNVDAPPLWFDFGHVSTTCRWNCVEISSTLTVEMFSVNTINCGWSSWPPPMLSSALEVSKHIGPRFVLFPIRKVLIRRVLVLFDVAVLAFAYPVH